MSSLNEVTGFDKLKEYYDKNCDKPWHEWLEVKSIFPNPGKQGLVGLMVAKKDKSKLYVFKISQYINYLTQHELTVMSALNNLSGFCPHYCRGIGNIVCEVDPESRKSGNPFEHKGRHMIEKDVILMEYLKNTSKFYNYIRSDRVPENVLYSTIKQVLMAVSIAQQKKRFTHYDLHSNNIMMKKCGRDLVILYILDDTNQFCVATRGYLPVIIDFGFSYVEDMVGGPLWATMGQTEVGFFGDRCDPVADPKLFLVTVSGEIYDKRRTKNSKKLLNITKNIFSPLEIDWDSGWDNCFSKSASDYVMERVEEYSKESPLFSEYDHYCVDILQTMIILPLEQQDYSDIGITYKTFIKEFKKIEDEIGASFYCLYILKGVVDAAREVRVDYTDKETRERAIDYFRKAVYERIDTVAKYCRPKKIHFEKMLCSLLCLGRRMEGIMFDVMSRKTDKKLKQYKKLPLLTPEQICSVIDMNIEDDYEFNDNTTVMVVDAQKESCGILKLTKTSIDELNELESISRGAYIYDMLNKKSKHIVAE